MGSGGYFGDRLEARLEMIGSMWGAGIVDCAVMMQMSRYEMGGNLRELFAKGIEFNVSPPIVPTLTTLLLENGCSD